MPETNSGLRSRHAPLSGSIKRSLGFIPDEAADLVVELQGGGMLTLSAEPADRKLRRGEKVPSVTLNLRDVWENRKEEPTDVESRIDKVIARMPIADFTGPNDRVGYLAKAWLMKELQQEFENG